MLKAGRFDPRAVRALAVISALAIGSIAAAGVAGAAVPDGPAAPAVPAPAGRPGTNEPLEPVPANPQAAQHYFVILEGEPLASYRGGIPGLAGTAADLHGDVHLDPTTPAAVAYLAHLDAERARFAATLANVAPEAAIGWQYRYVLHGFSAEMTPAGAAAMAAQPGVRLVHPAEELELEMDSTAGVINLGAIWDAAGGAEEAGLGARIAILDSGGMVGHPWFNDDGMPPAPDGYPDARMVSRDGTALEYPDIERFVNNKLIGARTFVRQGTTTALNSTWPSACSTGGCSDHGVHVAGIATGRAGPYEYPLGSRTIDLPLSGVAPLAHMFVYVNNDSTPGMAAAIEYMIEDEIDVFNASLGHVGWLLDNPLHHPIALAIDAAADAGVLAVVSAGNAGGNGPTSLSGSWKYSERLIAVGNTSTSGSFDQEMVVTGAEGMPENWSITGAPRGQMVFERPISGELYWADSGCAVDPAASGKIAVVYRLTATGAGYGACDYRSRSTNMRDSGALAIVFHNEDRTLGIASPSELDLPAIGLGVRGGRELMEYLRGGGTASATIAATADIVRGNTDVPDILAESSSQGPGLYWEVKPDISAPGVSILSSRVSGNFAEPTYSIGALSGTSMSSPHVAGAAALLRGVHPDWTTDQVRSALITTAAPVVQVGAFEPRPAMPSEGGPGRLDLTHTAEPGAFVFPPKLSFGKLSEGQSAEIEVTVESASPTDETWSIAVETAAGDAAVATSADEILVPAGDSATFTVSIDTDGAVEADHHGLVVLTRAGAETVLRQRYYARLDIAETHRNVLVVDWTYGDTESYGSAYTDALDELGLTWTLWVMDEDREGRRSSHPPFAEMSRHDLVILNTNESNRSLQALLSGQFQYQNYLLGGGTMLIAGQGTPNFWRYLGGNLADTPTNRTNFPETWPRQWLGPVQNTGCEMCIARYFAGFTPEYTATLSGRLLVPLPTAPDRPEREVVLRPHDDADGPFDYAIDISTGAMAPEGAAGNQYTFASGRAMDDYVPSTSSIRAAGLGDVNYAETMLHRIAPLARPIWAYTGDFLASSDGVTETRTTTVGTYVAGQQNPEAEIPWNAMFWGFGLEGVGEGADETVSRERLLGDVFNFIAANIHDVGVEHPAAGTFALALPEYAADPPIGRIVADMGDGSAPAELDFDPPVAASELVVEYDYAESGEYSVEWMVYPAADAAPFAAAGTFEVEAGQPTIYLPLIMRAFAFDGGAVPSAAIRPRPERAIGAR